MIVIRLSNCLEIENPPKELSNWLLNYCVFELKNIQGENLPNLLKLSEINGNILTVPRGLLSEIKDRLNKLGHRYIFEDLTVKPTYFDFKINESINYKSGVFGYQKRLVDELKGFRTVRLEAPGGSGKTLTACLLIGELRQGPALFLVNKDRLLRQFVNTAVRALGIPKEEIGIIKADKFNLKPVTVGSLQTLGKEKFDLSSIKNYFNMVFFDECHISTAVTYRRVILGLAPQRLIGLSATPEHYFSESLNNLMYSMLGPIGVKVSESEIPERLVPEAITRETGLKFPYKARKKDPEWLKNRCRNKLFTDISNSNARNSYIYKDCRNLVKHGHKVLIAVARITHGKALYDAFIKAGLKVSFPYKIRGEDNYTVDHKKLDIECELIENGEIDILIGTYSLFQTGFDCKALSAILFAAPFSGINTTSIRQSVYRIQRHSFNKTSAVVIDYVDDSYPTNILRRWGEDRAQELIKISKNNHSVIIS